MFDNFDEEHGGETEPETEHAADVRQEDLGRHRRLVLDDQREVALQHDVQLQKVLTEQRNRRNVLT